MSSEPQGGDAGSQTEESDEEEEVPAGTIDVIKPFLNRHRAPTGSSFSARVFFSAMSSLRTFVSAIGLVGLGGFGYWMWTLIVPGEERRRELLKVRDDLKFSFCPGGSHLMVAPGSGEASGVSCGFSVDWKHARFCCAREDCVTAKMRVYPHKNALLELSWWV